MGGGSTFPAGADITEFLAKGPKPAGPAPLSILALTEMLDELEKPVVCAIHGQALGGGCELSLACHWRIAASDAKVSSPPSRWYR